MHIGIFLPAMALSTVALAVTAESAFANAERQPNHLLGTLSPYLQQHLFNPVDWHPWAQEALSLAQQEDKPIFVSVGYSSCHWCHVMAEESFENVAIAEDLNAHFVSIKIDRETRPDLDARFMAVTELLTGSAGWPNSVFLTPDGDPFFAGGYFPPDQFLNIVKQLAGAWSDNPDLLAREGAKVAAAVNRFLAPPGENAMTLAPEDFQRAALGVLPELDPFSGGLGVAPKFPDEPLFLFLLDQAFRTGDVDLLNAITGLLDGMIQGGVHDHAGGGFHRYAIDPEWVVPHFEKMLYTQALTGRLLLRTWDATRQQKYRRAAERTFDYVLSRLHRKGGGFYATEDADSISTDGSRHEGLYYTWRVSDLARMDDGGAFLKRVFGIDEIGNFEGRSILALAASPEVLADQEGLTTTAFWDKLDAALAALSLRRDPDLTPFRDEKIILSWNGLMIETLAEAAQILNRPEYYKAAAEAARFLLPDGVKAEDLNRIHLDGNSSHPALLSDFAALGLGLLALHDAARTIEDRKIWLASAEEIATVLMQEFRTDAGLYAATRESGNVARATPVDDTMLPSGNALALRLFAQLADRTTDLRIKQEAEVLASLLSAFAIEYPIGRAGLMAAIGQAQFGETGKSARFGGSGAVKVTPTFNRTTREVTIRLDIAEGWHVNAHEPLEEYLIPTSLERTGGQEETTEYPEALVKSLSFNTAPLALYEGTTNISLRLEGGIPALATLTFQPCSDEICLPPEEMTFSFW